MGARFRLKASYDISGYSPQAQVVLRAMQQYGLILADNGSNWYFGGTADDSWPAALVNELKEVPASAFEAVDESSLMIDPNSGRPAQLGVAVNCGSDPGYRMVASDGGIFSFCQSFLGSMGGQHLNAPMVGMAETPGGNGYWEVASDGGIFSYGNAVFHGSTGSLHLNKPIVGMAATPDGNGYWLVASDGGIFSLRRRALLRVDRIPPSQQAHRRHGGHPGRQRLLARGVRRRHLQLRRRRLLRLAGWTAAEQADRRHGVEPRRGTATGWSRRTAASSTTAMPPSTGSAGSLALAKPIVGMQATSGGGGYWLVASDGGIFSYGNAVFNGSTGGLALQAPIVAMG